MDELERIKIKLQAWDAEISTRVSDYASGMEKGIEMVVKDLMGVFK